VKRITQDISTVQNQNILKCSRINYIDTKIKLTHYPELTLHISISDSPPKRTSKYVIKSSGRLPPKFVLNLVKIATKSSGEMCFAASIRNPENPIDKRSKQVNLFINKVN